MPSLKTSPERENDENESVACVVCRAYGKIKRKEAERRALAGNQAGKSHSLGGPVSLADSPPSDHPIKGSPTTPEEPHIHLTSLSLRPVP